MVIVIPTLSVQDIFVSFRHCFMHFRLFLMYVHTLTQVHIYICGYLCVVSHINLCTPRVDGTGPVQNSVAPSPSRHLGCTAQDWGYSPDLVRQEVGQVDVETVVFATDTSFLLSMFVLVKHVVSLDKFTPRDRNSRAPNRSHLWMLFVRTVTRPGQRFLN